MGYDTIHETVIQDIVAAMKEGIKVTNDLFYKPSSTAHYSSLTKATKGLIMEFPVLVSKANHIESAGIVAKAYEAKFVTLLHLAFAACGITNDKDGLEFLRGFHTNLDDKMSVDEFIDVMDGFVKESTTMTADSRIMYEAVRRDMKNLCFYFDDDIKESSLNSYSVMKGYNTLRVVKEADDPVEELIKDENEKNRNDTAKDSLKQREKEFEYRKDHDGRLYGYQKAHDKDRDKFDREKFGYQKERDVTKDKFEEDKFGYQKDHDAKKDEFEKLKFDTDTAFRGAKDQRDTMKDQRDAQAHGMNMMKASQDLFTNYIVPSDLKKANEMVPTMMIVNFVIDPGEKGEYINKQMVIGVKAKLYEVEPVDVINKIITKNVDNNILLKLVKVSTREISFVRDFLLAIDSAKVDALSRSKRGSANKLFKVLERRALGGKIRKALKQKDYCKAITSLVISQEEAEELLKNNIDVSNPKIIRPIMEKLNLISFAIIDESSESVKFLFDTGDDVYETIPLSKLEREQKDGMSKKVINLMAKMNR